ncbi:hypothetical protein [Pandoraea capi]|uniref:hypothetical protein n=1 Tax=Pandoraea capi TaxID=2508286 RepID=UPI00124242DE|nr:hypothetical protein [Pandoraea capi]
MTFSCLRRHAWCMPVALSLWGASAAPAIGAESATPPASAADPASPDAPTGPLPDNVLHDFARPALSVATSDWRMVNASVSGAGHAAMGHAMPMPSASGSAASSMSGHEAMGHAMPSNSGGAVDPHAGHNMQGGAR